MKSCSSYLAQFLLDHSVWVEVCWDLVLRIWLGNRQLFCLSDLGLQLLMHRPSLPWRSRGRSERAVHSRSVADWSASTRNQSRRRPASSQPFRPVLRCLPVGHPESEFPTGTWDRSVWHLCVDLKSSSNVSNHSIKQISWCCCTWMPLTGITVSVAGQSFRSMLAVIMNYGSAHSQTSTELTKAIALQCHRIALDRNNLVGFRNGNNTRFVFYKTINRIFNYSFDCGSI